MSVNLTEMWKACDMNPRYIPEAPPGYLWFTNAGHLMAEQAAAAQAVECLGVAIEDVIVRPAADGVNRWCVFVPLTAEGSLIAWLERFIDLRVQLGRAFRGLR